MHASILHEDAAMPLCLQLREHRQEGLRGRRHLKREVIMDRESENCHCGTVESLASDRHSPIEYDKKLNEYNLVWRGEKASYRLYFCFFCGGKLPESKRASLFTEPSAEEMKEVAQILGNVKSIQQALQILGEPDNTVQAPKVSSQDNGKSDVNYKRHHFYLRRWKTLDLTIRERKDGSIDSAFTGKYKGKPNGSAAKARGPS